MDGCRQREDQLGAVRPRASKPSPGRPWRKWARAPRGRDLLGDAPHGDDCARFLEQAADGGNGKKHDADCWQPFVALRRGTGKALRRRAAPVAAQGRAEGRPASGDGRGGAGARLEQHLDAADRQPHRHALHRASARQIGVKVFGPDLETIDRVVQGNRAGAQKPIPACRGT